MAMHLVTDWALTVPNTGNSAQIELSLQNGAIKKLVLNTLGEQLTLPELLSTNPTLQYEDSPGNEHLRVSRPRWRHEVRPINGALDTIMNELEVDIQSMEPTGHEYVSSTVLNNSNTNNIELAVVYRRRA